MLHTALLAVPWLWARDSAALLVLAAWVLASGWEGLYADETRHHIPSFERHRAWGLLGTVGLCLAFPRTGMQAAVLAIPAGFALRIWAIRALDGAFSVSLRPQGAWVASGPYRWMRHPSELGLILAVSGAVVATGSLAGAVSAVVLVAIPSIQRVRLEPQPHGDVRWTHPTVRLTRKVRRGEREDQ